MDDPRLQKFTKEVEDGRDLICGFIRMNLCSLETSFVFVREMFAGSSYKSPSLPYSIYPTRKNMYQDLKQLFW